MSVSDTFPSFESAALKHCSRLLESALARTMPKADAQALVICAFTYGAAWALDRTDLIDLGNAQLDSSRAARNGSVI